MSAPQPTASVVLELEAERRAALVARDETAFRRLVDEQCLYVHSSGMLDTTETYAERLRDGGFTYEAIDVDAVEVRIDGPVGIVSCRQTARMVIGADPHTSVARCTAVWLVDDDRPRLLAFQSTPLAPPPEASRADDRSRTQDATSEVEE